MLAAGEWLFHDLLHFVPSPFSGQLIAVACYNAFWLTMVARLLYRATGAAETAFLGTAVFLLVTVLCDHDFLAGAWFPNLYFFPFATMLLATARLVEGRTGSLPILALSIGFLVNGHASFVAIVAIVLFITIAVNYALFRSGPVERRIVGAAFFRSRGRRVAVAVAIFLVFLIPLALETALHFPGPVAAYITFSGTTAPHGAEDILLFLTVYWGGVVPLLAGIATLSLVFAASAGPSTVLADRRGLVCVLAAASCAVLFYARYGVDELQYKYLAYFYYAVPAITVALTAMVTAQLTKKSTRRLLGVLVGIGCLVVAFMQAKLPARYAEQYDDPTLPQLYETLKTAAAGKRIVLDLDNRHQWDYLWTHVVGAESFAKRRHADLFCINRNWHILFGETARCTPNELHLGERYLVRAMKAEEPDVAPLAFTSDGLRFYRSSSPDLTDIGSITVASRPDLFSDHILESGWDIVETDHAWSVAREAHLSLRLRPGFDGFVVLDLDAFLPKAGGRLQVIGRVDDGRPVTFDFTHELPRRTVELPVMVPPGSRAVDVRLDIGPSESPKQARVGTDPRVLGVALHGMSIRPR